MAWDQIQVHPEVQGGGDKLTHQTKFLLTNAGDCVSRTQVKATKERDQTEPTQGTHTRHEALTDKDRNDWGKQKNAYRCGNAENDGTLQDFDS
jgi:hypothetical protein